jgi:hypothetical protein
MGAFLGLFGGVLVGAFTGLLIGAPIGHFGYAKMPQIRRAGEAIIGRVRQAADTVIRHIQPHVTEVRKRVANPRTQVIIACVFLSAGCFAILLGIIGVALGGMLGFCVGIVFMPLSFGLSLPFFTVIGALLGFLVGASFGCFAGFPVGGLVGRFGYNKRSDILYVVTGILERFQGICSRPVLISKMPSGHESEGDTDTRLQSKKIYVDSEHAPAQDDAETQSVGDSTLEVSSVEHSASGSTLVDSSVDMNAPVAKKSYQDLDLPSGLVVFQAPC